MLQVLPISFGGLGVREGALVLVPPRARRHDGAAVDGRPALVRDRCSSSACSARRRSRSASAHTTHADRRPTGRTADRDRDRDAPRRARPMLKGGRRSATATSSTGGSRSSRSSPSTSCTRRSGTRNGSDRAAARSSTPSSIISLEHHLGIFHEATIQELGAALQAADHHGQLPLRLAALHRDDRRRHLAVPQVQRRLPALPQHARDHHRRSRSSGSTLYPLMPPRLLDTSPGTSASRASSTRSPKYPTFWSFNSGPGGEDLEPVRGDAERAHRLGDVVRARAGAAHEDDRGEDPRRAAIRSSRSS